MKSFLNMLKPFITTVWIPSLKYNYIIMFMFTFPGSSLCSRPGMLLKSGTFIPSVAADVPIQPNLVSRGSAGDHDLVLPDVVSWSTLQPPHLAKLCDSRFWSRRSPPDRVLRTRIHPPSLRFSLRALVQSCPAHSRSCHQELRDDSCPWG